LYTLEILISLTKYPQSKSWHTLAEHTQGAHLRPLWVYDRVSDMWPVWYWVTFEAAGHQHSATCGWYHIILFSNRGASV